MSLAEPALQRLRMSYEEWLALPPKPKAEWVDGEVVVTPHPSFDHQSVSFALAHLFKTALPALLATQDVGVWVSASRIRIPDVMVIERPPKEHSVTDTPVLVVEILSPSTRGEDMVRKSTEYAGAGIGQYWIVDPEHRSIEVYAHNGIEGGGWDLLVGIEPGRPRAEVEVGDHGTVPVDLDAILAVDRS